MRDGSARLLAKGEERALAQFLARRPRVSAFASSNLARAGITRSEHPHSGDHWAAFDRSGAITAVASHLRNGMLTCLAEREDGLVACMRAMVRAGRGDIRGAFGEPETLDLAFAVLGAPDEAWGFDRIETLMARDLTHAPVAPARATRRPTLADHDLLVAWREAYERETLGMDRADADFSHLDGWAQGFVRAGEGLFLVDCGAPVAMAAITARAPDCVVIGSVWTPRACRGQGFATEIMNALLAQARADGASEAVLFTLDAAARRVYEKTGFVACGQVRLARALRPILLETEGGPSPIDLAC